LIDGIVARTVVEGSMTREMFLDWMEFDVVSAITKLSGYCIYIMIATEMLCIPWPVERSCDGQHINSSRRRGGGATRASWYVSMAYILI
jgi:hypothetical protein